MKRYASSIRSSLSEIGSNFKLLLSVSKVILCICCLLIVTFAISLIIIPSSAIISFTASAAPDTDKKKANTKPLTDAYADNLADDADAARLGKPAFQIFTDHEGIPQNSIMTMAIDRDGIVWVGTQDGAAYHNGRNWVVVNMPNATVSNFVLSIMVARDNSVWFGTGGDGIAQRKEGKWISYNSSKGLPNDVVESLLETTDEHGEQVIWAGTHGSGLARLYKGQWTTINERSGLPNDIVLSLIETTANDNSHIIWAGTENGLACLRNNRWQTVNLPVDAPMKRIKTMMETIEDDGTHVLWVGIDNVGLARFKNEQWTIFTLDNGLPNNRIASLMETKDVNNRSVIWMGTYNNGVNYLRNDKWQTYNMKSGLPNNVVSSMVASKNKDGFQACWFGTDGGGLARLQLGKWLHFDTSTGLPNNIVMDWAETFNENNKQTIWMSMDGGKIVRMLNGKITIFDQKAGIPEYRMPTMLATKDSNNNYTIWAGTWGGGLLKYDGNKWTNFTTANSPLPNNNIFKLIESQEHGQPILLIGTDGGGIARLNLVTNQWTMLSTKEGLPSDRVLSLQETIDEQGKRTLWVGSWDQGISVLSDGKWQTYNIKTGLPGNTITCFLETRENDGKHYLWIGTLNSGIVRLDLSNNHMALFNDKTNPKLPNNTISRLVIDAQKRIYILTNKGLVRMTSRTPTDQDSSEYSIYTFMTADGLPSNECTSGAMIDSRNRVWAGTLGGAILFDSTEEVADRSSKLIRIERASVNDREHVETLKTLLPNNESNNELAYNENNIAFEYSLLNYFREAETTYCTQMVGYDSMPSAWTADYKSNYTNLGKGDYKFLIWAKDYAGNVSGPMEMSFRIKPALWYTWWAYVIYLILIGSIIYGVSWLRLRSLQRSNQILEARIAERTEEIEQKNQTLANTVEQLKVSEQRALQANQAKSIFLSNMSHELRTPLNAILGFTQILERDKRLESDQRQSLTTISRSSEHLLGLINDILSISKIEAGKIVLTEDTFDLHHMLTSIEDMIRVRANAKHLHLLIDTDHSIPQYVRGDEGKLRQVLINLLGNSVKFTDQGGIVLRAKWANGRAFFEIEDTGQGISKEDMGKLFEAFEQTESGQKSKEGTGLGLVISRNFVLLMDGDIKVKSELGKGTIFSFDIKMLQASPEQQQASRSHERVIGLAMGQPSMRLMIVDDREENRMLLARLLTQIGFQVKEAVNGKEAIDYWQSWHPHLVWMDMRMPVMDGITATRTIREKEAKESAGNGAAPHVCIIGLTASAFEHDRDEIMAAGCDDFVAKPFRDSTIFDKIREYLNVQYIYEDAKPIKESLKPAEPMVTAGRMASLPAPIIEQLKQTLYIGDVRAAQKIIKQIIEIDEKLALELQDMLDNFRLDEIIEILDLIDEVDSALN